MSRPKSRYIPALDGLRAFAVLAVIAYHMNMPWARGGLLGVTIFFVLSGYLITGLLLAEYDHSGTISLKDFWLRRARRILPAVLFMLVIVCALCVLFNHALLTKMRPDIIPTALFFNNWWQIFHNVSYFQTLGAPSPVEHCWSLSIEEQFYLVWPLLLLAALRSGVPKRMMQRATLVLVVVSIVLMALLYSPTADPSRAYYGTDTRAFSLLIGALLAMIWPARFLNESSGASLSAKERTVLDAMGFAAIVGLALMVALTNGFTAFAYRGGIALCSLLSAVAIAVMVHPVSLLAKLFSWKPLVWIGKLSYSLYLWHFPVLLLTTPGNIQTEAPWWLRIVQLALMLGITWFSYTYIENPIRHGALKAFLKKINAGASSTAERLANLKAWAKAHVIGVGALTAASAIALVGCAVVPSTSALEGAYLLESTEVQTNISAIEQRAQAIAEAQAEAEAAARRYDIVLIGDSVTVRTIPYFDEHFPHGLIDSLIYRQFYEAPGLYQAYADQDVVGSIVVFALGTNGIVDDEQVDELMGHIGSDKLVWFINTRSNTDWQDISNAALARAAERYDNVSLVDWFSYSSGHPEYFDGDGTHLTEEGASAYIDMLDGAVRPYLPVHQEAPQTDVTASTDEAAAE